jgi:hypothetical protein
MTETVPPVYVKISLPSIYSASLAEVTIKGGAAFSADLPGTIVAVEAGVADGQCVRAVGKDQDFTVCATVLGLVTERSTRAGQVSQAGPDGSYGMRFYPFVSSVVVGAIDIVGGVVASLQVETPNDFRLIWYGAHAECGGPGRLHHSFDRSKSCFVLTFPAPNQRLVFTLPIRLSSERLMRLVSFPILYWLLALAGIAVATFLDKPSVAIAAVLATWTFMLRQWNGSDLPQQNTPLTWGYVWAALFLPVWLLAWRELGWWAAPFAAFALWPAVRVFRLVRGFAAAGNLTQATESWWCRKIRAADGGQRDAWAGAEPPEIGSPPTGQG